MQVSRVQIFFPIKFHNEKFTPGVGCEIGCEIGCGTSIPMLVSTIGTTAAGAGAAAGTAAADVAAGVAAEVVVGGGHAALKPDTIVPSSMALSCSFPCNVSQKAGREGRRISMGMLRQGEDQSRQS